MIDDIEKYRRIFRLYKKVDDKARRIETHRIRKGKRFGIAVDKDEDALDWQKIQMRREILLAFLEGRKARWCHAYWLSSEDRNRRS